MPLAANISYIKVIEVKTYYLRYGFTNHVFSHEHDLYSVNEGQTITKFYYTVNFDILYHIHR